MYEIIGTVSSFFLGLYFSVVSSVGLKPNFCSTENNLQYCYYQGSPGVSRVIYFFHGFGNDTEAWSWNPVTKRIDAEWEKQGILRPHIVTISFGKLWWYSSPEQGTEITKFMQLFELKLAIPGVERVLYGDSMGGHNAYRFAHDYPHLFRKVALICPALPVTYVPEAIGGMWPFYVMAGKVVPGENPLGNQLYWKTFDRIPEIHLILSKEDHFGFYPGGMAMAKYLRENANSKLSLEEQDVFHCNVNATRLAMFLGE